MRKRTGADDAVGLRAALLEALALKELPRAGWVRAGVEGVESVAAHSWGVAWLVLALCPEHLDLERALSMAVVHDLAEIRTGDLTPHDGVAAEAKLSAEQKALGDLVRVLPRQRALVELWQECEGGTTPEGRFVKDCDRLDMALQAERYATEQGIDTREFVASALAAVRDPSLRALIGTAR
jgi:putative hydrolase of HD superfamily